MYVKTINFHRSLFEQNEGSSCGVKILRGDNLYVFILPYTHRHHEAVTFVVHLYNIETSKIPFIQNNLTCRKCIFLPVGEN